MPKGFRVWDAASLKATFLFRGKVVEDAGAQRPVEEHGVCPRVRVAIRNRAAI